MKCVNIMCSYWKEEECPTAEGCAGFMDETPCTAEERKERGCTEWCGLQFAKSELEEVMYDKYRVA